MSYGKPTPFYSLITWAHVWLMFTEVPASLIKEIPMPWPLPQITLDLKLKILETQAEGQLVSCDESSLEKPNNIFFLIYFKFMLPNGVCFGLCILLAGVSLTDISWRDSDPSLTSWKGQYLSLTCSHRQISPGHGCTLRLAEGWVDGRQGLQLLSLEATFQHLEMVFEASEKTSQCTTLGGHSPAERWAGSPSLNSHLVVPASWWPWRSLGRMEDGRNSYIHSQNTSLDPLLGTLCKSPLRGWHH